MRRIRLESCRNARALRHVAVIAAFLHIVVGIGSAVAAQRLKEEDVVRIAAEIRAASTAKRTPDFHPLPLAAHWNTGARTGGFDPEYQLMLIEQGRYLLPWFGLAPPSTHGQRPFPDSYYQRALARFGELQLPISFLSTQWDVEVAERVCARASSRADRDRCNPASLPLSPVDAPEDWYQAGQAWGRQPVLELAQSIYPNPPLVLFVSNNEQAKQSWSKLRAAHVQVNDVGSSAGETDYLRAVGDAWIDRYRGLQGGFRDALQKDTWQQRAKFIGYDAFGPSFIGRWPGWREYALQVPGRLEPWSAAMDGASVSYYVNDWNDSSDHTVWSPQVEAMNWIPMEHDAIRRHPDYWLEMSTWDGQQSHPSPDKRDKRIVYQSLGQHYDAGRYGGMVQFGMWLLRPRVVREFRDHLATRTKFGAYFEQVMDAVGRVHEQPLLSRFWQYARLVPNPSRQHPYQSNIPTDFTGARWFLLDVGENPPPPWNLRTSLPVYALALVMGEPPHREWLVYAFSPLEASKEATVAIPDARTVKVRATREGCFWHIREDESTNRSIACQ